MNHKKYFKSRMREKFIKLQRLNLKVPSFYLGIKNKVHAKQPKKQN